MGLRAKDVTTILESIPGIKELGRLTAAGTGGVAAGAGIGAVTDVPSDTTLSQHITDSAIRGGYTGLGGAAGSTIFKQLAKKITSNKGIARNVFRKDVARLGGTTAGAAAGYHLGTKKIDKRHAKRQLKDKNLSELQVEEGSDMDSMEDKEAFINTSIGAMLGSEAGYNVDFDKEAAKFEFDPTPYARAAGIGGLLGGAMKKPDEDESTVGAIGSGALRGAGIGLGSEVARQVYDKPGTIMGDIGMPVLGAYLAYKLTQKKKQQEQPETELAYG